MKGLLLAEHLGALLVIGLVAAWLGALRQYTVAVIAPLRSEASAYHAANVALATGAKQVVVADSTWRVTINDQTIEVASDDQTYTFTPGDDAD